MKTDMDGTFWGWLLVRLFGFACFLLSLWVGIMIVQAIL